MIRFDLNMEHDEALMMKYMASLFWPFVFVQIVFLQKICRLQKTDSASLSQEVKLRILYYSKLF